jgi:hypothetical protein
MIEIEFLPDEHGNQQVIDLITSIANRAMEDEDYAELAARIAQLLDYMKAIGVPPIEKRTLYGISSVGNPITLVDVVKELNHHPPLMEARANWRPIGAFRAIFFYEINDKGNQSIYFTKAVIKQATYSRDFEHAISASEKMMVEFFKPE